MRGGRASPTTPWPRCGRCWPTGPPRRSSPSRSTPRCAGLGADGISFETIVAVGPNGAKPHAPPVATARIGPGELVVLDFGALVDGYRSDMTRTVVRRRAGVADASAHGRRGGREPGGRRGRGAGRRRRPGDVDAACRDVIAEAGWGDAFMHGTGHGVGLEIHEAPRVSSTSTDTLAAGHVVTVEPGVYLPEHGGVRIEDTVVVTDDGCRPLTHATEGTRSLHGDRLHQRPEERHDPRPARGPVQGRRVPAREAGQGRRLRAHQAQERPHRRRGRPHLPGRREARAGHHRQAGDAVPLPRRRRLRVHGQRDLRPAARRRRPSLGDAAKLPEGGRLGGPADVRRRDRRRRPARRGRADRHRDRARRPGRPGVGRPQAGHARDRPGRAGAAVREPGRPHQGRHPLAASTSPGPERWPTPAGTPPRGPGAGAGAALRGRGQGRRRRPRCSPTLPVDARRRSPSTLVDGRRRAPASGSTS